MQSVEVKFGEWIKRGFSIYLENLGTLLVANLLAIAVGFGTLGILLGPMLAGVALLELDLVDSAGGGKLRFKDGIRRIFDGFDVFLPAFLFVLLLVVALLLISVVFSSF